MSLITWKDEFSVGVAAVDLEHRERISAHFALEEKIMRKADYDGFATHKHDHERLLDELLDVIDSVDDAGRYDRPGLSRDLDRWFSGHFRTHDAQLHQKLG
jgi:hemerythrin-like metal-binding protein